ncbi:patatin-like phospholipase family protein [Arsukibacterium sp.]|uniref:patatin-like phospholipase family protein n=1 Tax=Arsukibacterium sp. TaxID=1977258 RepID=UPI002FD88714
MPKSTQSSSPLRVLAGRRAYQQIQQQGLRADDIQVLVGASGGPKWFVLYGLDRYLLGEFFAKRQQPLHLLGSSAGAWRFSCYAQQQPLAALERFAKAYSTICYPPGADSALISHISAAIIDDVFPAEADIAGVLANPVMQLNVIVARAKRFKTGQPKWQQVASLCMAAGANLVKREHLQHFFQRVHFHLSASQAPFLHSSSLATEHVAFSAENLKQAVLASGSIPLVLDPIVDIAGAAKGLYIDGGITDYHFDLPFSPQGLVLYPHFYPKLTPGWFDKALRWRRTAASTLDNVVILCPSAQWIASLPLGKIPDRTDFKLPDQQRIENWQQVLSRSTELAEAFATGHYQLEPL